MAKADQEVMQHRDLSDKGPKQTTSHEVASAATKVFDVPQTAGGHGGTYPSFDVW
jgi:hypothetical protein